MFLYCNKTFMYNKVIIMQKKEKKENIHTSCTVRDGVFTDFPPLPS